MAVGFAGGWGGLRRSVPGSDEGAIQSVLAGSVDDIGLAATHLIGCRQADTGMVMLAVVPIEEVTAERRGILDAAEALRKLRLVFHGLEVAFRERIVFRGVQSTVGFADAEIGEQQGDGHGLP